LAAATPLNQAKQVFKQVQNFFRQQPKNEKIVFVFIKQTTEFMGGASRAKTF